MSDETTPRVSSGTLQRWPMWASWARECAGRLARMGKHVEAEEADMLALTFDGWAGEDPGQEGRARAIAMLFRLREKAGLE